MINYSTSVFWEYTIGLKRTSGEKKHLSVSTGKPEGIDNLKLLRKAYSGTYFTELLTH